MELKIQLFKKQNINNSKQSKACGKMYATNILQTKQVADRRG